MVFFFRKTDICEAKIVIYATKRQIEAENTDYNEIEISDLGKCMETCMTLLQYYGSLLRISV